MNSKQLKRRSRIVALAEERFFSNGFVKVSLDELVTALKISKSTIYEFFGSKEGLVAAVVVEINNRLEEGLEAMMNDEPRSVQERIIAIAEYQSETTRNMTNRFVEELKVHAPDLWQLHQTRRQERIQNYYGKLIDEGIAEGLFSDKYSKEFLLQLYLKMSEIVSYTDLLDHVPMLKPDAYTTIMEIFIKGTSK